MENVIQFLGRLHPLIVHLPIGFLVMTLVLHGWVWKHPASAFRSLLPLLWLASCLSAVVACLAGYLLSLSGDYPAQALNGHMYAGIALAVFSGVVFALLRWHLFQSVQLPVAVVVLVLLMVTGHLGGNLTHGEDYFTQPLAAMLNNAPATPARQPVTNINQAVLYADLVEPILEQKCWQCHSAQKQKGGLRLDTKEFLQKGGKHGAVLAAGDLKSDLYQRLLLPEEDDKRMPPIGKPQLSASDMELIQYWIMAGKADFTKRVADLSPDEKTRTLLAHYGPAGARTDGPAPAESELPTEKVVKANPAAIQAIQALGVVVTPITPDQTLLSVDMVNTPDFGDAQLSKLLPLRDQLVWLDLSATQISDKGLAQLVQFKKLTRLSIDNTRITDVGLAQLSQLAALRHLNLYGTAVTDAGLASLKACKKLQTLYLWQTQVTPTGVASLQKALGSQATINYAMNETPATNL